VADSLWTLPKGELDPEVIERLRSMELAIIAALLGDPDDLVAGAKHG
jgi:hypothetical protein